MIKPTVSEKTGAHTHSASPMEDPIQCPGKDWQWSCPWLQVPYVPHISTAREKILSKLTSLTRALSG